MFLMRLQFCKIMINSPMLMLKDGGGSIDVDEVIKLVIGLFAMGGVEVRTLIVSTCTLLKSDKIHLCSV